MATEVTAQAPGQWTQKQFSDTYWKARQANGGQHLSEESMAWLLRKRGMPHIPYFQKFLDEGRFDKKTAMDALNQRGDQYLPFVGAGIAGVETLNLLGDAKAVEAGTATPEQEEAVWRYQIDMLRPKSGWYKFWDLVTDLPAPALEFAAGGAGAARLLSTGIKEAAEAQAKSSIRKKLADFGIRAAISGAARVPGEAAQRALNAGGLHTEADGIDPDQLNLVFASKTGEVLDYLPEAMVSQLWETASEMSGALFASKVAKADVFAHAVRYLQVKAFGAAAAKQGTQKAWEALNKLGYQGGGLAEGLEEVVGGLGRWASDAVPGLDMDDTLRGAFPETFTDGLIQYLAFSVPGAVGSTVGLAAADPSQFSAEEGGPSSISRVGQIQGDEQAPLGTVPRGTPVEPSEAFPSQRGSTGADAAYVQQAPSQEVLADVEAFAPGGEVVEPTPELAAAARGAREMGTEVYFIKPGEAGTQGEGASFRPGSILVDATKARPDTIVAHEIVHDLSRSAGLEFQSLLETIEKVAPREMEAWRRFHRSRGGAQALRSLEPGADRRALRREETLADYASSLPSVIEFMATEEGEKLAKRIAMRDRTLWERLWDTIRRLVGQGSAVEQDVQRRLLEDIQRMGQMTGREVSQADVHVAKLLKNSMQWVARSREAGSPRVQGGPTPGIYTGGQEAAPGDTGESRLSPRGPKREHAERIAKYRRGDEDVPFRVFIRSHGGIRHTEGELDRYTRKEDPTVNRGAWGLPPLIGKGGMHWDEALRMAIESGYIEEDASAETVSTMDDLLRLLEDNPLPARAVGTGLQAQAEAEIQREWDELAQAEGFRDADHIQQVMNDSGAKNPEEARQYLAAQEAPIDPETAFPWEVEEPASKPKPQPRPKKRKKPTAKPTRRPVEITPIQAGGEIPEGATEATRRHFALGSQPREQRANISGDENVRNYMRAIDVTRNDAGMPGRESVADWEAMAARAMNEVSHAELTEYIMDAISERGVLDPVETIIARRLSAQAVTRALASGSVEAHTQAVSMGMAYRESGAAWGKSGVARRDQWPKTAREELSDVLSQETTRQRRYFNRLTRVKRAISAQVAKSEAMKRSRRLRREIASIERELEALRSGADVDARLSPEEGANAPKAMTAEERAKRIKALEARLAKAKKELATVSLSPEEQLLERRLAEVTNELNREMERDAKRMVQAVQKLHEEGIDPALVTSDDLQDPATRRRIAQASTDARSDGWDWFLAWRYNSMLSWLGTHARNIAGNTLNMGMEQGLQRAAEGIVASIIRTGTSKRMADSPYLGEFGAMFSVMGRAMRQAMKNGWLGYSTGMPATEMWKQKKGIPIEGAASKIEHASVRSTPSKRVFWLDFLATRALQGADDVAKTFVSTIATEAHAYRVARSAGNKPGTREFMEARDTALRDPNSPVHQKGMDEALQVTFQQDAGAFANYILRGRAMTDDQLGFPMGSMLVPFVTTPVNIFKAGLRKVPPITMLKMVLKGIARKRGKSWGYKTEDAQFVTDAADLIIGAGLFWSISAFLLGDDDDDQPLITGSRDAWGAKQDLQYRTHPPLSFRLGDQWYSYAGLEPLATFLAPAVDAVDAWWIAAESGDSEQIAAAASAVGSSVLSSVQDKTFLRTIGELYQVITNPEYTSSASFARDTIVTPMVPNVIRGAMRESDDVYRLSTFKPDGESTPWGMLLSGDLRAWGPVLPLPNAPWTPPPKRDVWGREITRPVQINQSSLLVLPHLLKEAVPPSQLSPIERADLAMRAWNRKVLRGEAGDDAEQYYPSTPRVGRDWTPEEIDRLVLEAGTMASNRVRGIPMDIDDPTEQQIGLIKRAISRSYNQVRDRIRKERRAR